MIREQISQHSAGLHAALAKSDQQSAFSRWYETIRAIEEFINLPRLGLMSADTMRRIAVWRSVSAISEGVLFRRGGVDRGRERAKEIADALWGETDENGALLRITFTIGTTPCTRQGVTGIYRRIALTAARPGLGIAAL